VHRNQRESGNEPVKADTPPTLLALRIEESTGTQPVG